MTTKQTVNLTGAGKKKLEAELADLKAERPAVAERIATARAFGDLSENEEYSAARKEQNLIEDRIQEIETILKNAKVIRSKSGGKVRVGSTVRVKIGRKEQVYMIVGAVEANPLERRISDESPIGQVLLGKTAGETAKLETPKGEITYKILAVE